MKTFLVWILITLGSNGEVSYSPPVRQFSDCKKLLELATKLGAGQTLGECVQVEMVASIATPAQ